MTRKLTFLILLHFCIPIILPAQINPIRFDTYINDIPQCYFYINNVIDGRANKKFIGTLEYKKRKDSIDLDGGAATAFKKYMNNTLSINIRKIPVTIKITELNVNGIKARPFDSVKVGLELTFYKGDTGTGNRIITLDSYSSTANQNSEKNRNLLEGYKASLSSALSDILMDFINSNPALYKVNPYLHIDNINPAADTILIYKSELRQTFFCKNGININYVNLPDTMKENKEALKESKIAMRRRKMSTAFVIPGFILILPAAVFGYAGVDPTSAGISPTVSTIILIADGVGLLFTFEALHLANRSEKHMLKAIKIYNDTKTDRVTNPTNK